MKELVFYKWFAYQKTSSLSASFALVCQYLSIGLCIGLEGRRLGLYLREWKEITYKQCLQVLKFCENILLSLLTFIDKNFIVSQSLLLWQEPLFFVQRKSYRLKH